MDLGGIWERLPDLFNNRQAYKMQNSLEDNYLLWDIINNIWGLDSNLTVDLVYLYAGNPVSSNP